MRLNGKVALVTGANSGIGQAIAKRFAEEGAHVAVNYLAGGSRDEAAKETVGSLATEGMGAPADVSKRADVESMVNSILQKFGRIDIVVNNAGVEVKKPFVDITDEDWQFVLGVNLTGAFVVAQTVVRQLLKQGGGGKVINISSVHEDVPFPGYAPYCTSKGGMRMLMRNMALELAPSGINVNNIAPGAIATPINQAVLNDPVAAANAISEIPWGRFGKPEDVAAVAVFLASDEAGYVTGSTYYVDGGLVQQVTKY